MKLLTKAKATIQNIKQAIEVEFDIASRKRVAKLTGFGFPRELLASTLDGGYPVYLADEFMYVNSRIKDKPQATAVFHKDGTKEIYVNQKFLDLSKDIQEAIIQHEVGHLVLNAYYTPLEGFLGSIGLSNKRYLCECAADDYSAAGGHKMYEALLLIREEYGVNYKELNKRIERLAA